MKQFTVSPPFPSKFLVDKLSWGKPLLAGIAILILCFGAETFAAFYFGLAIPREGGPQNPYFGSFIVWPIFSAIIMPLFVVFLSRAYQYSTLLVSELVDNNIIIIKSRNNFINYLKSLYSPKYIWYKTIIISIAVSILLILYFIKLPSFQPLDAWAYQNGYTPLSYVKGFTAWIQAFIILYGLWDIIVISLRMNYPAASRRGINYGHSRDLLIGNPWFDKSGFRLKKLPE